MKVVAVIFILMCTLQAFPQSMQLAKAGSSDYSIFIFREASPTVVKTANILQDYFYRVTGVRLPIKKGIAIKGPAFIILPLTTVPLADGGFVISTSQRNITIAGKGRGCLFGVYEFIEKYMGCRKWDGHRAFTPFNPSLTISNIIAEKQEPVIQYREVYFQPSFDDEYLDWHKLQRFENLWGLWGHSFFTLVPPRTYYKTHPEYFSLVNGKREPMQLCLSNQGVLKIVIDRLQLLINENPGATYWSVSANDDAGNCECDRCAKLDAADGGPQGSLIYFVNQVAAHFPGKMITTLAYGYSARATSKTKAASNVVIMLSSIDAYRTRPLQIETTAAPFRNNLAQWKEKTSHLFIWDYCTQFTNYLTPFPVTPTFAPNIRFLVKQGATGIFEQGSGDTHSDMAELKCYLLAKLLWNPSANPDSLTRRFLDGYYGKAAPVIAQYLSFLQKTVSATGTHLDIYGNPVNDHSGYLSPEKMNAFSILMDQAESKETDTLSLQHIRSARLSQEYVYLQQLKFYGKDKHGLFQKNERGEFAVRPGLEKRIERFTKMCGYMGIKELSEGGVSPGKYAAQWQSIINAGPKNNLAADAIIRISYPFAPEYPSKNERTLIDETPGYADFSYNWLCFYGVPFEATVDMNEIKKVHTISMNFLEDARHWIFRPSNVSVEVSVDGLQYHTLAFVPFKDPEEAYEINFTQVHFPINENIRYLRVKAANHPGLPSWRFHKNKKPMIACDEIWVK